MVKNPPANAGDVRNVGSIPGLEKFPGGGHGNPLQYSCLENPVDRGAWLGVVHGVTKSRIRFIDGTTTNEECPYLIGFVNKNKGTKIIVNTVWNILKPVTYYSPPPCPKEKAIPSSGPGMQMKDRGEG